jgi:hypothetical protein
VHEDEERIYKSKADTKHNFSRSDGNVPFLQFLATYSVPRTGEDIQRRQLKAMLYGSKLFNSLIWLIQAAIAATAAVVFYEDYLTIGFTTAASWQVIGFAAAGYMVASPLLVVLIAPFSRLGCSTKRHRDFELLERHESTEQSREAIQ